MTKPDTFELTHFLPYLLNQAAEQTGKSFEQRYRARHDMTRAQWRILANLGAYGAMTAAEVSRRAQTEKSKISRALTGMSERGLVARSARKDDRRSELLDLTPAGRALHSEMVRDAQAFDDELRQRLGKAEAQALARALRLLAGLEGA